MNGDDYSIEKKLNSLSDLCYEAELLLININEASKLHKRENFRRLVGIHLLALMLNTVNSTQILLKNESNYAAAILIRSLVEQLVNLRYIYQTSSYANLVRYLYDGDAQFIKNVKKAANTFSEYNSDGILDDFIEDAIGSIDYRVKSSNALKKYGYPLKSMPSFWDRVKMITDSDDDLALMFFYLYDYLTYSHNVHSSKDKVIEMTYAETYEDWFQAVGSDGKEDAFRMINTSGDIISMAFYFFSMRTRTDMDNKFHSIRKEQSYFTNIREYRAYTKH